MNKDIVATAAWSVLIVAVVLWMISILCLLYRIHLDLEAILMGHDYGYEMMDLIFGSLGDTQLQHNPLTEGY
jgi:hypothetical protein